MSAVAEIVEAQTADTLERLIARGYKSAILSREPMDMVLGDFHSAEKDFHGLKALAQKTLTDLSKIPDGRCFVSKTKADFLRRALSEES